MILCISMFMTVFEKFDAVIEERKDFLTNLDSAIGDSDHGINMKRGAKRIVDKMRDKNYANCCEFLREVAMIFISVVGGNVGPLYGTFFMKVAQKLGEASDISNDELADAMLEGLGGVMTLGKSSVGDKTMVDALHPAITALKENVPQGGEVAWNSAAEAAKKGMESTISLISNRGRSSILGERSIGHQDPGATSSYYLISSFRDAFLDINSSID